MATRLRDRALRSQLRLKQRRSAGGPLWRRDHGLAQIARTTGRALHMRNRQLNRPCGSMGLRSSELVRSVLCPSDMSRTCFSIFLSVSIALAGCKDDSGDGAHDSAAIDAEGMDARGDDSAALPTGDGNTATPMSDGSVASTPAPDGNGVCCPITALAGCETPPGDWGGWASSSSQCVVGPGQADGPPVVTRTDSHGCPELVTNESLPMDQWCGQAHLPDASAD